MKKLLLLATLFLGGCDMLRYGFNNTINIPPDESIPDDPTPDESIPDDPTPDDPTPDDPTPDDPTPDESIT